MHPIKRLQSILNPPAPPNTGRVVSVQADRMIIATAQGTKTVQRLPGDATGYKPGDRVRLAGESLLGRSHSARDVFSV